jgi:hypothetical protein
VELSVEGRSASTVADIGHAWLSERIHLLPSEWRRLLATGGEEHPLLLEAAAVVSDALQSMGRCRFVVELDRVIGNQGERGPRVTQISLCP